jgi:hypothetical protein
LGHFFLVRNGKKPGSSVWLSYFLYVTWDKCQARYPNGDFINRMIPGGRFTVYVGRADQMTDNDAEKLDALLDFIRFWARKRRTRRNTDLRIQRGNITIKKKKLARIGNVLL